MRGFSVFMEKLIQSLSPNERKVFLAGLVESTSLKKAGASLRTNAVRALTENKIKNADAASNLDLKIFLRCKTLSLCDSSFTLMKGALSCGNRE